MPVKKSIKKVVKVDTPSAFDIKTGIDVGNGKKVIPTKKKSVKKVNPFEQTMPMMKAKKASKKVNPLIVGMSGTIATKKKKVTKKPKFDYSKKFTKK